MERSWSLYNKVEKLRVDDLKSDQVRTILLAIPASQLANWYACQEGDLHWVPLRQVSEFYIDLPTLQHEDIAVFVEPRMPQAAGHDIRSDAARAVTHSKTKSRRPLFEDPPEDLISNPSLEIVKAETNERRSARRYSLQLLFRVSLEGQVFETNTVDISLGGLSVKDNIPTWIPRTFRAELSSQRGSINIVCKKVSSNQIRLMESDSWDLLRQWLVLR